MKAIYLLFGLLSVNAFADGHLSPPMTAHYGFSTENPAAVVQNLQTLMESDCGKEIPAVISLYDLHFNGGNPATHGVAFNYKSGKDLDKTAEIFNTCAAAQRFLARGAEITKPEWQMLSSPIVAGGNSAESNVIMFWGIKVADEAKYVASYKKMMATQEEEGLVTGNYGINRIISGSINGSTHFAYVTASSMGELGEGTTVSFASDAFAKFSREVAPIREIISVNTTFRVMTFN